MAGRPKYGFKKSKGNLVEDETQQAVIRMMINIKAEGATYAEIAHHLNHEKLPDLKNSEWTKRRVEYILSSYRDEINTKIEEELSELFGEVKTINSEESSEADTDKLPFADKKKCGSVFDWDWVSELPDGRYILEGYMYKYDEDKRIHEMGKFSRKLVSEKKAKHLIEQHQKEHEEIQKMVARYKSRMRREPYKFRKGFESASETARSHVAPAREAMESWVDLINKPDKALPATTKKKIRDLGRYLCNKLVEQFQWHLHLAQEVERLNCVIYSLEQELAKTKDKQESMT